MSDFVVEVKIPEQRVKDLICNAFEGGSNYWIGCAVPQYPEGKQFKDYKVSSLADLPFVGVSLHIQTDDDEKVYVLDRKLIEKGMKAFSKIPQHWHFDNFVAENDDAETADVFLQLTLFGNITYG
jgi:hypothetical protein